MGSASDEAVYCKCSNSIDASKYPHVSRWANFIGSFSPSVRSSWGGDEVDVYDDEETKQMMEKHKERIAEIQARQAAKKGKAKTNITIDVNPEDETTDMEDLQQRVTEVEIQGLKWLGEGNLIPTCFGMSKLTIMCQIFDEQVPSTQVIYDALEELEGVGSTREIASQMA